MKVITTVAALQQELSKLRQENPSARVGLVPTMGALHAGHLSLVAAARKQYDIVVVSVFVNPTQFNNPEDLRTYPRKPEEDLARLRDGQVDIAFLPTVEEMYPEADTRQFDFGFLGESASPRPLQRCSADRKQALYARAARWRFLWREGLPADSHRTRDGSPARSARRDTQLSHHP